ncbi:CDP-diacylglycerol--serine O-phosphatidyltransferase [Flexithrix dorotheae]|uniref:CDP-diacylglycerol--serine O-phosphatidyltransferase n=1 Tax=Flexithrix dorotheae TaxID=70993 RepID=UPI0003640A7C|nr:CDP-diacylglycerol--serine O-phosphatidyltransferase [Flexithrix dorotheae]
MALKKHIPNLFTLGNLICGFIAIYQTINGNVIIAAYLMGTAGLLDFLDGFVARLLKVNSDLGKQLDSLADMVTFGVLPGFIMMHLLDGKTGSINPLYLIIIIPACAALRLAKFNIDTRQSNSFLGVPTPATAFFIGSIPLAFRQYPPLESIATLPVLLIITFGLSFLMISEIPLFALKFKNFNFKENKLQFIFIFSSLILVLILKFLSIPIIILGYILISIISWIANK